MLLVLKDPLLLISHGFGDEHGDEKSRRHGVNQVERPFTHCEPHLNLAPITELPQKTLSYFHSGSLVGERLEPGHGAHLLKKHTLAF